MNPNETISALLTLASSLKHPSAKDLKPFTHYPKGVSKSGKTKRGATHKIGRSFKSRGNRGNITPAMYRRLHLGVITITPTYLLPHAAPRGRNVWTSK